MSVLIALILGSLPFAQASLVHDDDVMFIGTVTATEPKIIRIVSGSAEIEIPREYATKHYLAGDKAEIAVPEAQASALVFHRIAKRK